MFESSTTSEEQGTSSKTSMMLPMDNPSSSASPGQERGTRISTQHFQQEITTRTMNQVSLDVNHDEKLIPQSSSMLQEQKRPLHLGEGFNRASPLSKRPKTLEETLSSSRDQSQGESQAPLTQHPSGKSLTTGDTPGDASVQPQAGFGVVAPQQQSTPLTSFPPVVSPKESTKSTTAAISSFSSSSSASSGSGAFIPQSALSSQRQQQDEEPPAKATLMSHLRIKYYSELEYMLREFRKLEQQLLGVKGNGVQESTGSRERREKLHSFILHLEDTIRQIDVGCQVELEGGVVSAISTDLSVPEVAASSSTNGSNEKEDDDTIQKLEEHILANLLPVKVRLKKQLAAQQGATRNPIGMPVASRGLQPSMASEKGKGTFAAAAEEKRKQAEAARLAAQEQAQALKTTPTQFGKPLSGGGSSLTQKLHGPTLGSQNRVHGHGVGSENPPIPDSTVDDEQSETVGDIPKRKVLYAGMAPGSTQHHSGIMAAAEFCSLPADAQSANTSPEIVVVTEVKSLEVQTTELPNATIEPPKSFKPHEDPNRSEEERKKLHKERRRRKKHRELARREKERQRQLLLQQQQQQQQQHVSQGSAAALKGSAKAGGIIGSKASSGYSKGPRTVEYMCALCSEAYTSTCDYNPWWALASHECVKCRKTQIPRIDITSPVNAIEYHPALLAHAEEGPNGGNGVSSSQSPMALQPVPAVPTNQAQSSPASNFPPLYSLSDSDEESNLSELSDAANLSDDSYDSDDSEDDMPLTEGELAELESFGKEYEGPKLTPDQASRLLILIGHAQTCPGRSADHRDCCNSVKFLMLHVRDCPGTTSSYDICPFPWCRKVKHLLYHLVACPRPRDCAICSPITISQNLKALIGLTKHRWSKRKEKTLEAAPTKSKNHAFKVTNPTKAAKPIPFRPSVKKPTVPAKPLKPPVAKHTQPVPPKVGSAAWSGTNAVNAKAPNVAKASNGVVVKSLVKPAGRSVVVVKSRPQYPSLAPPARAQVATLPVVSDPTPTMNSTINNQSVPSSGTDAAPCLPALVPIPLKKEGKPLADMSCAVSDKTGLQDSTIPPVAAADNALVERTLDTQKHDAKPLVTGTPESSLPVSMPGHSEAVAVAAAVAASLTVQETDLQGPSDGHGDYLSLKSLDSVSSIPSGDTVIGIVGEGDALEISRSTSVVSMSEMVIVTTKCEDKRLPLPGISLGVDDLAMEEKATASTVPADLAVAVMHREATVSGSAVDSCSKGELGVSFPAEAPQVEPPNESVETIPDSSKLQRTTPEQLQEKLENSATSSSESLDVSPLIPQRHNSPPRFPDVPAVVNHEDSSDDTMNQEAPQEVPPV